MPDGIDPELMGWAGIKVVEEEWSKVEDQFLPFFIFGSDGTRSNARQLWECYQKVTGNNDLDLIPQPTGNCFPPGTMVTMADGTERPIQDISVGDVVLSHRGIPRVVKTVFYRPYSGPMKTITCRMVNRSVTCTADHRMARTAGMPRRGLYQGVEWVPADSLSAATDRLLIPFPAPSQDGVDGGLAVPIKDIQSSVMVNGTVHCIEVEVDHSFIANGYAVHNCVAAGAADAVEALQCIEIVHGDREEFVPVYNPFHYATGRVLIGKNRLKGQAGSVGIWQADAIEKYGVLRRDAPNLPKYNKANVNAWGDGRAADGKSYTDYMELAKDRVIKGKSRLSGFEQIIDALDNWYPCTIAASFGYQMKPQGGEKGFHRMNPSDPWGHLMSVQGYNLKQGWVALKNQWGDVHGRLVDIETGQPWPRGFLRVSLDDFRKHIRNAEVIAYSNFNGFPAQKFDHGEWA